MANRPISPDIVPSTPNSPDAIDKESVGMELLRSDWESDEDTVLHDPTDVASSPLYTPDRDEEDEVEEDG